MTRPRNGRFRRVGPYAPLSAGQHRRWRPRGPFRSVLLNAAGWSALLGATGVVAAGGALGARAAGLRPWPFLAVGVAVPVSVVLADRRKWSAIRTSFGWGASPEEVRAVAQRLVGAGVAADVEVTPGVPIDVVDRVSGGPTEAAPTASLVMTQGDLRRAWPLLEAWGVPVQPSVHGTWQGHRNY